MAIASRLRGPSGTADPVLSLLARFLFTAILLPYYWASGLTKLGEGAAGLLSPSLGAYAQIFPRQFEAAGYDVGQMGWLHWGVVVAGTWAEFLLPLAIALGLLTRLAALGMIGFVAVQTATDLVGHGALAHAETVGAWFDRMPDSVIMDQRSLWLFLLVVLAVKGGGALALDRVLFDRIDSPPPAL